MVWPASQPSTLLHGQCTSCLPGNAFSPMASFSFSCWKDLTVRVGTTWSLTQTDRCWFCHVAHTKTCWCPSGHLAHAYFWCTPSLLGNVLKSAIKLLHSYSYSLGLSGSQQFQEFLSRQTLNPREKKEGKILTPSHLLGLLPLNKHHRRKSHHLDPYIQKHYKHFREKLPFFVGRHSEHLRPHWEGQKTKTLKTPTLSPIHLLMEKCSGPGWEHLF